MIGLIVAYTKNRVIGNKGMIPWRIKGEQKQFKELTTGNVVVMGRKSYEEIGHPLPNRLNIIVSRTEKYEGENLLSAPSVQEAIALAQDKEALSRAGFTPKGEPDVYISGGYGLYKEAVAVVDKMYITEVDTVVEETDIDTAVPALLNLPHHVRKSDVIRFHSHHVDIAVGGDIF